MLGDWQSSGGVEEAKNSIGYQPPKLALFVGGR